MPALVRRMDEVTIPSSLNCVLASTGGSSDEPLARRAVERGIKRYIATRHERVDTFVDRHFSLSGAVRLNRAALGWDIVRAPLNLSLAAPQAGLRLAGLGARRAGADRLAQRLTSVHLQRRTDVARELDWHLHAELLELPYDDGTRVFQRDALAEAILADPELTGTLRMRLERITARSIDQHWRDTLTQAMAEYTGSRTAAAEMTTALVSLSGGALALNKLTPGALSLGPALAATLAQQAAVASFPLGASLGGLWYGWFPVAPPVALVAGLTGGLVAGAVLVASLAGVVADPVQRRLGLHQRRLHRLLEGMQRQLLDPAAPAYAAHDHYVARLLDMLDLLGAAYRLALR